MTQAARSPLHRFEISSRDREQAQQVLRETFGELSVHWPETSEPFRLSFHGVTGPDLTIGQLYFPLEAQVQVHQPTESLLTVTRVSGRLQVATPHEMAQPRIRQPVLAPTRTRWHADLANITADIVRISRAAADHTARSMFGVDAADLRFSAMTPLSPATARHWLGAVAHIRRHVLDDDEVAASPLQLSTATRSLAALALATFPHPALTHPHDPDHDERETPAAVRRALTYIEERAGEDIGVDDIAAAARTSRRALQNAFRKHRDCTPLEHLHRVRLTRAHADLQTADRAQGDTVAAIAARWQFSHPGRFSTDYRQIYGHLPSHTLNH